MLPHFALAQKNTADKEYPVPGNVSTFSQDSQSKIRTFKGKPGRVSTLLNMSVSPFLCVHRGKLFHLSHVCVLSRLADLAVFHQYISQSFNLSDRNTWISFGGSYSGALSAWFRGKVSTHKSIERDFKLIIL